MRRRKTSVLYIALLLAVAAAVFGAYKSSAGQRPVPITVLRTSVTVLDDVASKRAVVASPSDNNSLYVLDDSTGDVVAHDRQRKVSKRIHPPLPIQDARALAVGRHGNIYILDSGTRVKVLSPAGQLLGAFSVPVSTSLAVLSNGNVVIGSPSQGKLLHLYRPDGALMSNFGEMKNLDAGNQAQNEFLNVGKVVAGPADEIYYVFEYLSSPVVQKFSADGKFVSEFAVTGAAVDHQAALDNAFLRSKAPDRVGGYSIITAAAADPATGHLWLGMNGISTAGTVYEYTSEGEKVGEYAFLHAPSSDHQHAVTSVRGLAVSGSSIQLLTYNTLFSFDLGSAVARGGTKPRGFLASFVRAV